jgi:hypothetical protein
MTQIFKIGRLFRKCASWFQDRPTTFRNRGYNALAGQALWQDDEGYLYKLRVVHHAVYNDYYIFLEMGSEKGEPTRKVVKTLQEMEESVLKYVRGYQKIKYGRS